ncbi:AMP-binding protein [Streptomyces sp. DSM 40750]|uniref:AMP-binding protein n=1 Tax=Streptomyces sp. DSM 40750 TaxID=2801030 RepID=UPI003FA6B416
MDVRYPAERLRFTTDRAQLSIVVTTAKRFPETTGTRIVTPDELRGLAGESAAADERPRVDGDGGDAASVIYTSCSTGRLKGVVVPHRNVLALLEATAEDFGLDSDDTWTLFHSSAVDFSVWEIWGCLLSAVC